MRRRRKGKTVINMTNQEAAEHYVKRARAAQQAGDNARANRLFHSAVLHDRNNKAAKQGFAATKNAPQRGTDGPSGRTVRYHHRTWWQRLLGIG
ncbi:MAG TPA: hypothetical protein VG815_01040 [Chloroflexota bacterium]|nr:hypothetical protein [Chloroflexota bacterium]